MSIEDAIYEWQREELAPAWFDGVPRWILFFVPRRWRRRRYHWVSIGIGVAYTPRPKDVGYVVRVVVTAPNQKRRST